MNPEPYEFTNADKAHADRKLVGTMDQFKPGDLLLCRDGSKAVYVGPTAVMLVYDEPDCGPYPSHTVRRVSGEVDTDHYGLDLSETDFDDECPRDIIGPWSSRFPKLEWDGNRADTPFGEYKVYQDDTFDWCWVFGRDADCRGFVSEAEAKEHAGRDWADRLALAMGEVL